MDMIFCHGCGKEIHRTASACPTCGAPNANAPSNSDAAASKKMVGIITGIVLVIKKRVGHGIGSIVLSILMMSFWAGFMPAFTAALHHAG
jgi:uncharacterized membrane protein YvbJ